MKVKRLSMNFTELRKAEDLCARLQSTLHNIDVHVPEKFAEAKRLYKELGNHIKLSASPFNH